MLVEKQAAAMAVIRQNLRAARCEAGATCCKWTTLRRSPACREPFSFIFLDPPYAAGFYHPAMRAIRERELLAPGGRIVAEHDGSLEIPEGFSEARRKKYGKTYISYLTEE